MRRIHAASVVRCMMLDTLNVMHFYIFVDGDHVIQIMNFRPCHMYVLALV